MPETAFQPSSTFPSEKALWAFLISTRRHLHQHPEVGCQEVATARYIRNTLEANGLTPSAPIAEGTGLYVDIVGDHAGPTIGYRADIDALPIQDAKSVAYASQLAGVAHLCGHDAHTAMALGTALLLKDLRDRIYGTIRVFFQPNEEGIPSGAPLMIRDGVLDGLSAVYAYHVDPHLPTGTFGLKVGAVTAATDVFEITVKGPETGHSARPHATVDTVWVAHQMINPLYQLASRLQDARNPMVFTICVYQAGSAFNVIPDQVMFGGTLRTIDPDDRIMVREKITKICTQIADLYGADVDVNFRKGSPSVMNDGDLIDTFAATTERLYGSDATHWFEEPSMGGEDFAHYLDYLPGAMIRVGTANGPATRYALHDARFDLDERALPLATRLMTTVLIDDLKTRSAST